MKGKIKLVLFPLIFLLDLRKNLVNSADILFYSSMSSYSHRVVIYPLANALANRGHNVTLITPFHPREHSEVNPKIREIVPQKLSELMEEFLSSDFDISLRVSRDLPRNVNAYYPVSLEACRVFLESPELKNYLDETKNLDLLILDSCNTECGMAIKYKYNAKHMYLTTIAMIPSEYDQYGLIPESSAIPELEIFPPRLPMTFLQRVENALISIHFRYAHYNYVKEVDRLVRKFVGGEKMPFVDDMARNASLLLHTSDFISDYARSLPPWIVNVGGIHCRDGDPSKISKEIQDFIGDSDFIYVSLGSLVKSSTLPEKLKQVFFQTMEQYPKLKFMWKWNGPKPEIIPGNLLLLEWFPQADLLAHPKIRAFITQSGRPSTLESLCNAVPMIALPILGDQDSNSNRVNDMGGNVRLEVGTLKIDELVEAIQKAAYDERMKERMRHLKSILKDRPMSPLDTAVWYTEFVLRQNDTSHLRSPSFDQFWFQRRLLDVWAFMFVVLSTVLIIVFKFISLVLKFILKYKNDGKTDLKKKIK